MCLEGVEKPVEFVSWIKMYKLKSVSGVRFTGKFDDLLYI